MAINKVDYAGRTLIDLTADSVTEEALLSGYTAHNKAGTAITGSLVVNNCYVSSAAPSASDGANGDIWVVI